MGKKELPKPKKSFLSISAMRVVMAVTVLVLFGQALKFEYVLDDELYITNHPVVQEGVAGIADIFSQRSLDYISTEGGQQPYRPMTLLSFAIEKSLFDNSSQMAHLVNVLLFILVALGLFELLTRWLPKVHSHILFAVVMLFIAHPIHTEVVANIKSRDELLTMVFGVYSLLGFWKYFTQQKSSYLLVSLGLFLLACFSKESGITWWVIFPLSVYFFTNTSLIDSFKKTVWYIIPPVAFVTLWFVVNDVEAIPETPDVINNVLFGATSWQESFATKIFILGKYMGLLIFPVTLSWDYSFHQIPLVGFDSIWVLITLFAILAMMYWLAKNIKSKSVILFWIVFFGATFSLSSNFIIEIGATMAERFLFIPSLAFVFVLVWLLAHFLKVDVASLNGKNKTLFLGIIAVVFSLYSFKTYTQTKVWENNFLLAEAGVISAPNSARTHFSMAAQFKIAAQKSARGPKQQKLFEQAEASYLRSLEIYPEYTEAGYNLGVLYFETGRNAEALQAYQNVIKYHPKHANSLNNLGIIFFNEQNYEVAKPYFLRVIEVQPNHPDALGNLGAIAHNLSDLETAVAYYEKSIAADPQNKIILTNMVLACNRLGNSEKSKVYQNLLDQLPK